MKYITCRVHTSIVNGDIRVKHTYLEAINWHSLGMSYNKTDAMVFDTEEEIKPAVITARNTGPQKHDDYRECDYESENWIVEPITEKELFVQRLT